MFFQFTPGDCFSLFCEPDMVYITNFNAGIEVYDISDPMNPQLYGCYQTPGNARGIVVEEEYIYVTDEGSLQILRMGTTGAEEEAVESPLTFDFAGNYPNPFNASTTIDFRLSSAADVALNIYNIKGQLIESLVSGSMEAGSHRISWHTRNASSGIYIARLEADGLSKSLKMQLLK